MRGFADRQRAQDQGAVRNRLVAGHADAAASAAPSGGRSAAKASGMAWYRASGMAGDAPSSRRIQPRSPPTLLTAALPAAKGSTTFPRHPDRFKDFRTVAKPELGTKRLCGSCGAKFYDLNKDPIVCPKCDTVFEIVVPVRAAAPPSRGCRDAARRPPLPREAKEAEAEVPETADVELVSLEDADAEARARRPPAKPRKATTTSRSRRPRRRPSSKRRKKATTTSPTSSARDARTKRRLDFGLVTAVAD